MYSKNRWLNFSVTLGMAVACNHICLFCFRYWRLAPQFVVSLNAQKLFSCVCVCVCFLVVDKLDNTVDQPRSGELRTLKLKSHLVITQSLNVLPLKPWVGHQHIAIHATLTARNFYLTYFYPSNPFTCIFSKTSPNFFLRWLWLTQGSCVGPQNNIGHPAGFRFPCWVLAE